MPYQRLSYSCHKLDNRAKAQDAEPPLPGALDDRASDNGACGLEDTHLGRQN